MSVAGKFTCKILKHTISEGVGTIKWNGNDSMGIRLKSGVILRLLCIGKWKNYNTEVEVTE